MIWSAIHDGLAILPHALDVFLGELPLISGVGNLARQRRLRDLFQKANTADTVLPISNVLRLDLDHRHPRILRSSSVYSIAQIPEPSTGPFVVDLLDPRLVIARCRHLARDADPILVAAVLESNQGRLFILDIVKLLRVVVGKEEEVGTVTLRDGHGTSDRAYTGTVGAKQTGADGVHNLVEIIDLLLLRRLIVPLRGDRGVGLGIDVFGFQWLRHLDYTKNVDVVQVERWGRYGLGRCQSEDADSRSI